MGFQKIRGTFFGGSILSLRILVFWGLYWVSLILGNYRIGIQRSDKNAGVPAGSLEVLSLLVPQVCLEPTYKFAFLKRPVPN